ncbi:hypothetical protein ACFPOE_11065 [Caenimonas terrae]|uniref:Uncharacterized protein n=1 Tax=Caenimonas terrae TaxID=696074 RepID=A0ABW0NC14_9BURK
MISRAQSRQPSARHGRKVHEGDSEARRELARAEGDYQRLRLAYLALAQGEPNEVAMAMVGADMERANALVQGLRRIGQWSPAPASGRPARREARRLAEESA